MPLKAVPALVALTLIAPLAHAAPVLDQAFDPAIVAQSGAITAPPEYGFEDKAQTFTVGLTGTLTRVEVRIGRGVGTGTPTGNLAFSLLSTSSGIPNSSSPLATATIPGSDAPNSNPPNYTFATIDNLSVPVTQGTVLALALHNAGTNFFGWATTNTAFYPGGTGFTRTDTGPWESAGGFDFAFRTYVTVPEPSAAAILLAAPAFLLRPRKRAR